MPGNEVTQPFADCCKTSDPMWIDRVVVDILLMIINVYFCVVEQILLMLDFCLSTLKLWFILVYTVLLLLLLLMFAY